MNIAIACRRIRRALAVVLAISFAATSMTPASAPAAYDKLEKRWR